MLNEGIKNKALKLIELGEIEEALELLSNKKDIFSEKEKRNFSLISSNITRYEKEKNLGLKNDDSIRNRAIAALIDLLGGNSNQETYSKRSNPWKRVLAILLISLALLAVVTAVFYFNEDEPNSTVPCAETRNILGYLKFEKSLKPVSEASIDLISEKGRTTFTNLRGEFLFKKVKRTDLLIFSIKKKGTTKIDTISIDFCSGNDLLTLQELTFPEFEDETYPRRKSEPRPSPTNSTAKKSASCPKGYPEKTDRLGDAKNRLICCRSNQGSIICTFKLSKRARGDFQVCASGAWESYGELTSGVKLPASLIQQGNKTEESCIKFTQSQNDKTFDFSLSFSSQKPPPIFKKLTVSTTMGDFKFENVQVN